MKIITQSIIAKLLILVSAALFSSYAMGDANYRVQFGIAIDPAAMLGYNTIELIGYALDNDDQMIPIDNQPLLGPGTTGVTPIIDTHQRAGVEEGHLTHDYWVRFNMNLFFRLYPAYQHGRSVEVRITLAQLAGSDLAHVNPTTGFIGEPVYQTVPPGLARPDIRINYQRQSSEFTDDTPARLNFTFTSLITPLSRVGTILDFVLIGSQ